MPGREFGGVLQAMDYLPHANRAALDPTRDPRTAVPVSAGIGSLVGEARGTADEDRGHPAKPVSMRRGFATKTWSISASVMPFSRIQPATFRSRWA